jgi:hypothetical protein
MPLDPTGGPVTPKRYAGSSVVVYKHAWPMDDFTLLQVLQNSKEETPVFAVY